MTSLLLKLHSELLSEEEKKEYKEEEEELVFIEILRCATNVTQLILRMTIFLQDFFFLILRNNFEEKKTEVTLFEVKWL